MLLSPRLTAVVLAKSSLTALKVGKLPPKVGASFTAVRRRSLMKLFVFPARSTAVKVRAIEPLALLAP